jgi:hypothetical protein
LLRVVFGTLWLVGFCRPSRGEEHVLTEPVQYELAAGFLYNFAVLTTWPPAAFPRREMPLTVGVVGQNPFGASLARALALRQVEGRGFAIEYFADETEIRGCHVLFVTREANQRAALAAVRGQPVLTVGVAEDFLKRGGMIRLFADETGRVRFAIRQEAAVAAGLELSSRLLRLAELYEPVRAEGR